MAGNHGQNFDQKNQNSVIIEELVESSIDHLSNSERSLKRPPKREQAYKDQMNNSIVSAE